jgi:hypothetical protein
VLSPQLHAGRLTGDAGRSADYNNDNFSERLVYGFGLGVNHYLNRKWSVGGHFAATWKSISDSNVGPFRMLSYSARVKYFLFSQSKESPYGHIETGFISGSLQNYRNESLGLGTHPFIKIGAGLRGYTSAGTTTSFLLFYQAAFSENDEIEDYSGTISYDVTLIGVELGFGFGLKRR